MLGNYICFTTFPKIDELLCIFATFNCSQSIKISTYNHTVLKCRQLIFENSDVIAYPNLEGMYGIYVIVKENYFTRGTLQDYLKKHDLKYNAPSAVSRNIYEECCFYTLVTKLAPKWNILSNYLVCGRNFLTCTTPIDCIYWQLYIKSHGEATFNFKIGRIKMCSMSLEKMELTETLQNEFETNGLIQFRQQNSLTIRVLPSLKQGNVLQISKELKSVHFTDYQHMRRYWKNTYGYRLPENHTGIIYFDISFFDGSPVFTYPSICVHPYNPVFLQRIQSSSAVTNFMTDLLKAVPKILGSSYPVPSHISKPTCELSVGSQITPFSNTLKISLSPTNFQRKNISATQNPAFVVAANKTERRAGKIKNERSSETALTNLIAELNKEKHPTTIVFKQLSHSDTESSNSEVISNKNCSEETQHFKSMFSKTTDKIPQRLSQTQMPKLGDQKLENVTHNHTGYSTINKPCQPIFSKVPPSQKTSQQESQNCFDTANSNKTHIPIFSKVASEISQKLSKEAQKYNDQTKKEDINENKTLTSNKSDKPIFSKVSSTVFNNTNSANANQNGGAMNKKPYKPIFPKVQTNFLRKYSDTKTLVCDKDEKYETRPKNEYNIATHENSEIIKQNEKVPGPNLYKPIFAANRNTLQKNNETVQSKNQNPKQNVKAFTPIFSKPNKSNIQVQNVTNIKKNMALQMQFLTQSLSTKSISSEKADTSDENNTKKVLNIPKFVPKFRAKVSKNAPQKHSTKINKNQAKAKTTGNAQKLKTVTNAKLPKHNNTQMNIVNNLIRENNNGNIPVTINTQISTENISNQANQNSVSKLNIHQQTAQTGNIFDKESCLISLSNSVTKPNQNSASNENFYNSVQVSSSKTENLNKIQIPHQNQLLTTNNTTNLNNFLQKPESNVAIPFENSSEKQKPTGNCPKKEKSKRSSLDKQDNESSAPKKVRSKPVIQEISDDEMLTRMRNNTLEKVNVPNLIHWLKEKAVAVSNKDKKADLVSKIKCILSVMED